MFQETHQDLADKTKYLVVELSDIYKVPTVLAEPKDGVVKEDSLVNFDLTRHYMGEKLYFLNTDTLECSAIDSHCVSNKKMGYKAKTV